MVCVSVFIKCIKNKMGLKCLLLPLALTEYTLLTLSLLHIFFFRSDTRRMIFENCSAFYKILLSFMMNEGSIVITVCCLCKFMFFHSFRNFNVFSFHKFIVSVSAEAAVFCFAKKKCHNAFAFF